MAAFDEHKARNSGETLFASRIHGMPTLDDTPTLAGMAPSPRNADVHAATGGKDRNFD
ncbi:MAG: hypothetical protein ABWZ88_07675 [Variovorax sp.]